MFEIPEIFLAFDHSVYSAFPKFKAACLKMFKIAAINLKKLINHWL